MTDLRGGSPDEQARRSVDLPARPFLYTIDQIQTLLHLTDKGIQRVIHYDGRTVGKASKDTILARNIGTETADWRVAERELIRWMRRKGYRIYERTWAKQ